MSSMGSACESPTPDIEILYENQFDDTSIDPPREEWSSLNFELPEANIKRLKYDQGLYHPGSGEICAKYIPLSASSVLRHPYYNYPGIVDPGIEDALLLPEDKVTYPDDGQELYLFLCKTGDLSPIKNFYHNLLGETINLSYYGINPKAFRPIALSLKWNRFVTTLNLTDNWISLDGCFHLGEMLMENITLKELNLYGCRIGPEGARRLFVKLHLNRSLKKLNLSYNQLKDKGVEYLAKAIFLGSDVAELILTKNEITGTGILALCEAFETTNKLTHLDLSWNNIFSPNAIYVLCQRLSENDLIQKLNLSWNSLSGARVGNGLKILLKNPKIKYINLSNNKLSTSVVVGPITSGLARAVSLDTLDLSYNPLTPEDALDLILSLKERKIKLKKLLLDDVIVSDKFIEKRDAILSYPFRKKTVVTHGYVQTKFVSKGLDMRELILNRIETLCKKPKKKIDFALIAQEIYKSDKAPMDTKQFSREVKSRGAQPLDETLLGQLYDLFPGPRSAKVVTVDTGALVDYLRRKWPDRKLPPTPPEPIKPSTEQTEQPIIQPASDKTEDIKT